MALIYVDRTRYTTGLADCMMARFLGHHFLGTGINLKGNAIPLATGTAVHSPLEAISLECKHRREEDPDLKTADLINDLETSGFIRGAIEDSIESYVAAVDETGIKGLTEVPEDIDYVVTEQCNLVGGLVWTWVRELLPWVLDNYKILAVEQEFELILACTCGLGEVGSAADHEARDCNGVCLMTRPDLVLEPFKNPNTIVYVEFKTGGDVKGPNYARQFEDNVQFACGAAALERFFDKPVEELYVHALHKGKYSRSYNVSTREYSGPKRQNSPFCHVFFKEAVPPAIPEDVRPTYYTKDPETGKRWGATEKRGYFKTELWNVNFRKKPDGIPNYEWFVNEIMTPEDLQDQYELLGPIKNPHFLVERLLKEMAAEEQRWQQRLEYLDGVLEDCGGDWVHEEYQEALSEVIPRSWKCYNYGGWCGYQTICFQREGWQDPLGLASELAYAKYERQHTKPPNREPRTRIQE